ncbi:MAG: class I SAM-dependent methyltransferase [archaeon]
MTENLKTTAAPWKAIADMWNTYFTQPSRVSREESDKYKAWISGYADPSKRILLLGATPEIRESLAVLNCHVTCIDINKEMISAMNSVMKTTNPNENIINENWLENSLSDGYFDIVIGDAVLPNVAWEDRDRLLLEVKRVLRPHGLFITRAFCVPRKKPFGNVDELLTEFSSRKPDYQSALQFVLELQILAYDPSDHLGTFSRPKEMLEKLRGENGFDLDSENLNKILEMVWNFWCGKFLNKAYTYAYRDEEEEEYLKYFEIAETYEARDNSYSEITPMYVLKLR